MKKFQKIFNINGKTYNRQVILEAVDEFDEFGNITHSTQYSDHGEELFCEEFMEYDSRGNEIHYKNSDGIEWWYDYDENNSPIRCKFNDGTEEFWAYDKRGNEIYHKDYIGEEYWWEYDKNNNKVHEKYSDGSEFWLEYDEHGNETLCKDFNSVLRRCEYDYDKKGNKVYSKSSNGYEEWCDYDDQGNMIHSKDSRGNEYWFEYNDHGEQICEKHNDKVILLRELDENGYELRNEGLHAGEHYFEYEFYESGKLRKRTVYNTTY